MNLPILYSFRRCPYAIRARMALAYAGISCELREVSLKNKPEAMLAISPKGTTPVLQLSNGLVLEESLDIMYWALDQNDPDGWLALPPAALQLSKDLIATNDLKFKVDLDRYKYYNRFPEESQEVYRRYGETYLQILESQLQQHQFLLAERITLADVAIFPFIRQFAYVDWNWFQSSHYQYLQQWLNWHENRSLFQQVMQKIPVWSLSNPANKF